MSILLNLLPLIAGVLLGITYIPQIAKTHRTKNVEGMSVLFWIILVLALSMMTVNAVTIFFMTGAYGYLITEFFNTGLAVVVLCQVLRYRKKEKR